MKNKMTKLLRLASYAWLASLFLLGCRADREEELKSEQAQVRVELSLGGLTAQIEDDEIRALNFKWQNNDKGQLTPQRTLFDDGARVPVHTVIRDKSGSLYGEATLEWVYDAKRNELKLTQEDQDKIVLIGMGEEALSRNTEEVYIAGVIGGELKDGRVTIANDRILKAVEKAKGDDFQGLILPYAFPWTKVSLDLEQKDDTQNYAHATASGTGKPWKPMVFKPQGFLIEAKLGNSLGMDIKAQGLTIFTRSFNDMGDFNLKTSALEEGKMPVFEGERCPAYYTFKDETLLKARGTEQYTYYIWAYPTQSGSKGTEELVSTRVTLRAERQDGKEEVTHTYLTDYAAQVGSSSGKKLADGRVYRLRANAFTHLHHPMDYMGKYSLAGGDGYGGVGASQVSFYLSNRDGNNPRGRVSADPHLFQNEYYTVYFAKFLEKRENPSLPYEKHTLIDEDGSEIIFESKYRIPEIGDIWSILFPFGLHNNYNVTRAYTNKGEFYGTSRPRIGVFEDRMKLGEGDEYTPSTALLGKYSSEWNAFRRVGNRWVMTALRFAKTSSCEISKYYWDNDSNRGPRGEVMPWIPIQNDDMRTAYRYSIGVVDTAEDGLLLIEAVHLGDEKGAGRAETTANAIQADSWWTANQSKVIRREYRHTKADVYYILASSASITSTNKLTDGEIRSIKNNSGIRWTYKQNNFAGFAGFASSPANTQVSVNIIPYYKQAYLDQQ